MPLKATSVRLDDETLDRVGQMAEALERPRAWLMAHAIKQYVEREESFTILDNDPLAVQAFIANNISV